MEPVESNRVTVTEEFIKNPSLKQEDLEELRKWTTTQKHLPNIPDWMLIQFHHTCYYDIDRSKNCIEKYYTIRTHAPEVFTNRDITNSDLARSAEVLGFAVLPIPDPDGNYIYYQRLRNCDPAQYIFTDHIKFLHMSLDALVLRHGTMPGYVIVYNVKGFSIGHVPKHGLSVLKMSSQFTHEANPIRLKGIHVTNVHWWMPKAYNVLKPFINKNIGDKMHFHSSNETLYKYIPKKCLPEESEGDLESTDKYRSVALTSTVA